MRFKLTAICFTLCLVIISGCKNSFDEPAISKGNADFSRFVALGGSFIAGYGDGALHYELQRFSFPSIIASKFALVGGGTFKQPLVNPGAGLGYDISYNLLSKLTLSIINDCKGNQVLSPMRSGTDASNENWIGMNGPFNNLGVPGAKSFNLAENTFGRPLPQGNPFYHRFASNNIQSSTIISDYALINPTFFILWIGMEDVWQYARSGGIGDLDSTGVNDITPVSEFNSAFDDILSSLLSGNISQGAIANIPDISSIPFFTAIPYNGLVLTAKEATALNATSGFNFIEGANAFVVYPPNSNIARQLKPGEFVLLSVSPDSIKCGGWGTPQHPIPDNYILDSTEVSNVRTYTFAFNQKIANAAIAYDLAFVDMQRFFDSFKLNQQVNGVFYSNQYLRKSIFSVDGIYPNARGHAFIANAFIEAINAKYMSTLPDVDVNAYHGNDLP